MIDVAALAGVSHQTVSRVINNKDKVKEETRIRVMDAIAVLGYRRNEAARTLASSRSRLFGVITPRFAEWGPMTTLHSVQLAASRDGYFVSVAFLPELTSSAIRVAVDDLLSLGVAGLIVISPLAPMARELNALSIPVPTLAIASSWVGDDSKVTRIGIDQERGVREALEHLVRKGCKTVAHVAGPAGDFDAMDRVRAWRQCSEDLGLVPGVLVQGGWSSEEGYAAGKQLLQQPLDDAVFVANDQMALGVLKAFGQAGVKVPDEVRVFGFDDQAGGAFFEPSLTTIRQGFTEVGHQAIEVLTAMLAGQEPVVEAAPTMLVVRESA